MMKARALGLFVAFAALMGCATAPQDADVKPKGPPVSGDPVVIVTASVETVVTTDLAVDADDPALWADARNPSRAVMFGTDKTDGLYVHNLDGGVRQFLPSGALNNVDLRTGFPVDGRDMVLVAASNDQHLGVNLYLFDPDTLETKDWGFVQTGPWIPYGFCMGKRGKDIYLIANSKAGEIRIWTVAASATGPETKLLRTLKVGTQPEGCVVDDQRDALYVGEEDVALWRFDFNPAGASAPVQIAAADGQRFTADIEGVTIMRDRGVDYLIASSQGDNSFPVYRIDADAHVYLGRFHVGPSASIDEVTQTDGVDAWSGPIGQFPEGVVAMHDTDDAPTPGQQNFKLVDWRDIKRALKLP
jgi:3-phytase